MKRSLLFSIISLITILVTSCTVDKKPIVNTKVPNCVFMGNSITENWHSLRESFFVDNDFVSKGIGGQTSAQMLARFSDDVVYLMPKTVSIMAGINDIAQNQGYISNQDIMKNIAAMAEKADRVGIKVILCSVLPAKIIGWNSSVQPVPLIKDLNDRIKRYAVANSFVYLDYYSALVDKDGGLPPEYTSDGVHPTVECYKIMEKMFLDVVTPLLSGE